MKDLQGGVDFAKYEEQEDEKGIRKPRKHLLLFLCLKFFFYPDFDINFLFILTIFVFMITLIMMMVGGEGGAMVVSQVW